MKTTMILCALAGLLVSCCGECAEECREDYTKAVEAQLKEIGTKMAALKATAGEGFEEAAARVEELTKDAEVKFEELKKAGADAWEAMKPEVDAALDHLKKAYEKARASFE